MKTKMKAVFISQQNPTYDDFPGVRYHFPKRYLKTVQSALNDSIVYYESGRVPGQSGRRGRKSYFGVARVIGITPDEKLPDHFYAHLADYLPFTQLVPLRREGVLFEQSLNSDIRQVSGVAQSAVRPIPDGDFERILSNGFGDSESPPQASDAPFDGFQDPPLQIERPRATLIYERPFRDRVFKAQIQSAYDKRCAVTGLRLVNGGGRAEAQAAHIVPVSESGPDLVQNGLSLSSTVHWMFDRGLISVEDDFRILTAKHHVPPELAQLVNKTGHLIAPDIVSLRPHAKFLRWHREKRFNRLLKNSSILVL
jgi:putative restriction endonuclease